MGGFLSLAARYAAIPATDATPLICKEFNLLHTLTHAYNHTHVVFMKRQFTTRKGSLLIVLSIFHLYITKA